jgi:hypothetical protein
MKRNIWIFGSIAGLIVAAFMVVSSALCYHSGTFEGSMLLGYAGMLLAFSFVFVGIKNYRDQYNNGTVTFAQGLKIGGLITLIAATVYVVVWLFDFYLFIPDFMEKYIAHTITQAKADGATQAELNEQIADMAWYREKYKNPVWVMLLTYCEILPVGIVVILISALILKRNTPKAETVIA